MVHLPRRERSEPATRAAKLRQVVEPLRGAHGDYDRLLDQIGEARLVLIGEASHGTKEFYRERAVITRRLIEEKGFNAVTAEADWPDAFRVNRFVRGLSKDSNADDALASFDRFPRWMWRNKEVLSFVKWLRAHNDRLPDREKVGFYGLDLYCLHTSIDALLKYLVKADPASAAKVRDYFSCLDAFEGDSQVYGSAVALGITESCRREVLKALEAVQARAATYRKLSAGWSAEDHFDAQQNAIAIRDAEEYYRTMFRGRVSSWNLRDQHMARALEAVGSHLEGLGNGAKIVVWAHNSHLGDARATEMGRLGELNLGQLAREHFGKKATKLIGLSTYEGTVTCATDWDDPAQTKEVRPALRESYEALFHQVGPDRFYLNLERHGQDLELPMLERAIGVIYRPETERQSHYFDARLAAQFDAILHFDRTTAVEPLDGVITKRPTSVPDTYPFGE